MTEKNLSFPQWRQVLKAAGLSKVRETQYEAAIFSLLRFCKEGRRAVSVSVVKEFLARPETPQAEVFREGLRWFWREGVRAEEEVEGRKVEGLKSTAARLEPGGPSGVGRTSGLHVPTSEGGESGLAVESGVEPPHSKTGTGDNTTRGRNGSAVPLRSKQGRGAKRLGGETAPPFRYVPKQGRGAKRLRRSATRGAQKEGR